MPLKRIVAASFLAFIAALSAFGMPYLAPTVEVPLPFGSIRITTAYALVALFFAAVVLLVPIPSEEERRRRAEAAKLQRQALFGTVACFTVMWWAVSCITGWPALPNPDLGDPFVFNTQVVLASVGGGIGTASGFCWPDIRPWLARALDGPRGKGNVAFAAGCIGLCLALISSFPVFRGGLSPSEILPPVALMIVAFGAFGCCSLFWRSRVTTHGRARLATLSELRQAGIAPCNDGILLGNFIDGRISDSVGYQGRMHLITVGPPGSGKGMSVIIPNIYARRQSMFIIDPKGQAAAITARARAKLGPVKIINPFGVLTDQLRHLKSTGFNPLAALDPADSRFVDDCVSIAQALVQERPGSDGKFFADSAHDLLTALIIHEKLERGDAASLANVRKALTRPYGVDSNGNPTGLAALLHRLAESPYEPLSSKAGRFTIGTRSTLDVIATAITETRLLDSPMLQADLSGEAIDWDAMKREITTTYLIIPADFLKSHAAYLRLVVTSALNAMLRTLPQAGMPPVLFILDEFAHLGRLESVESAAGISRDYGVQLWPFLQSLAQLKDIYKDNWETFLGARAVLTAYGPRDKFTAEYLSGLCGKTTVIVESESDRSSGSSGQSRTPQGMPLFNPDDLAALPEGVMLNWIEPVKYPFLSYTPYYWNTNLAGQLDPNPYFAG